MNKNKTIKDKWLRLKLGTKIRRIVAFELELHPWQRLTEKKAIDLFLKYKKAKFNKKRPTIIDKKRRIIVFLNLGDKLLKKRSIRKPRNSKFNYYTYLQSKEWKILKEKIIKLKGNWCHECGAIGRLQLHHIHYDNLYREKPEDLKLLCADCHKKEHGIPILPYPIKTKKIKMHTH